MPSRTPSEGTYVIVGGGAPAAGAVEGLREGGCAAPVLLLAEEPLLPYERRRLTGDYLSGAVDEDALLVHPQDWYDDLGVIVELGTRPVALHPAQREVELDGGRWVGYERLLLAPRNAPARPASEGELAGVHRVHTLADAARLRARLSQGGRVVVVGGSWTGLEIAAAARAHGAAVTVLEADATPLFWLLGPELGEVLADVHRAHGVDVRTGVRIDGIEAGAGGPAVRTSRGLLAAETVVLAGEAAPDLTLAAAAGLAGAGTLPTDALLRTADPYVYAVDADSLADGYGQGLAAGRSMAGKGEPWENPPLLRTRQYDLEAELRGCAPPGAYDAVVLRGEDEGEDDESMEQFLAFWLRRGHVVAALSVNVAGAGEVLERLVRAGAAVDADALADPGRPLLSLL
ncbi:MAG: FAD-dependent oxidoreductase [Actinomycetota bacterium]|nr:FAD-dependent oxidoreductase [Actinomycetota bacterium]